MLDLTTTGNVAVLRMHHGKANALDLELCEAIVANLDRCRAESIGALVITGEGKMFSAGVDLVRLVDGGAEYVRRFLPAMVHMFEALFTFDKPVVAAINGHAIAGGCIIASAADWRIMSREGGRIGVPELLVGVPFPAVPLEIIRFAADPHHLQTLVYSGVTLTAERAQEHGLVDLVVNGDALMGEAMTRATALAAIRPAVFAFTKRQVREPAIARMKDGAARTRDIVQGVWESPATLAAIRDYVARTLAKS